MLPIVRIQLILGHSASMILYLLYRTLVFAAASCRFCRHIHTIIFTRSLVFCILECSFLPDLPTRIRILLMYFYWRPLLNCPQPIGPVNSVIRLVRNKAIRGPRFIRGIDPDPDRFCQILEKCWVGIQTKQGILSKKLHTRVSTI